MKFTWVIQIYRSIFVIKNGINNINISSTSLHKRLWIYYVLWLEMAERTFLVELHVFSPFILIHFGAFCDVYTVDRQYTELTQKSGRYWFLLDVTTENIF